MPDDPSDAGEDASDLVSTAAAADEDRPNPDPATPASFPLDETPPWATSTDGGTTRALSQFLTISPCLDLYQRSGSSHRGLFGLCFVLDLVIRLAATALIIAILGAVAWKTLAPLPAFWDGGT